MPPHAIWDEPLIYPWKARTPAPIKRFAIYFAPTRTKILSNSVVKAPEVDGHIDLEIDRTVVVVEFPGIQNQDALVQIDFHYIGERPIEIDADWRQDLLRVPTSEELYRAIYDARESIACREREQPNPDFRQSFFFDFDRFTNADFIEFIPDTEMSAKGKGARMALVKETESPLLDRLFDRFVTPLPKPPVMNPTLVRNIGAILECTAADWLGKGPGWSINEVLLDFAAGELSRRIKIDVSGKVMWETCTEPDSYMIFLFAELGIHAKRVSPVFWTDQLLFDMVRMQRYYLRRCLDGLTLRGHTRPQAKLTPCQRTEIDEYYERRIHGQPVTPALVDDLIAENLALTTGQ